MAAFNFYQPVGSPTWTINHNLGTKMVAIDVLRLSGEGVYTKVFPTVELIDDNNISVTFNTVVAGRARVVSRME